MAAREKLEFVRNQWYALTEAACLSVEVSSRFRPMFAQVDRYPDHGWRISRTI
jgi:hypothetical protein